LYSERQAATDLLLEGRPEVSLCIDLNGIPTKARADWLNTQDGQPRGYIVDVKTTGEDTDKSTFINTCDKWGYLLSAALYTTAFEKFYDKPFDFYFIVLGKYSKTCDVYRISKATMLKGKAQLQLAFDEFESRAANNSWKDYRIEEI